MHWYSPLAPWLVSATTIIPLVGGGGICLHLAGTHCSAALQLPLLQVTGRKLRGVIKVEKCKMNGNFHSLLELMASLRNVSYRNMLLPGDTAAVAE